MAVNILWLLNRFSSRGIIGRKGFTYMLVSSLLIVVSSRDIFAASDIDTRIKKKSIR